MTAKKRKGGVPGEALGGMLAGFDQQIMRTLPPPHELVQKGAPVRGLSGDDDADLVIVLPGEPASSIRKDGADPDGDDPAEDRSP
jgi:hypothetical protein